MPNLPLNPIALDDPNCYPATPQALVNQITEKGSAAQTSTLTGVILQDTTPAVADRDKVWVRTSGGRIVFPSVWHFTPDGEWAAKHPTPPSDPRRWIFVGADTAVPTLDGGAVGTVGDYTGPFWEIDSAFAFRVPIGVGSLPVTGTVLAFGDTGGIEQTTLTLTTGNLPSHRHDVSVESSTIGDPAVSEVGRFTASGGVFAWRASDASAIVGHTRNIGSGDAITLSRMQPYIAVYFIRRTARVYCTSPIT